MSAAAPEETPELSVESDAPPGETQGNGEETENGLTEPDKEEPRSSVEPKMEGVEVEAGEEKPAAERQEAGEEKLAAERQEAEAEAVTAYSVEVNQGETAVEEPELKPEEKPEEKQSPEDGNNIPAANDNAIKDAKEQPGQVNCEKSKAVCEDGEKPVGGGGELDDKRRPSVEISSSDGEPLSRIDSEDRLV
ncbi:hypothetical protein KUCAC02_020690 [Chaenocephalus aceratus]|uniref:Uncharacterized protein n=1 Tax=Chaenocephalus aceratus TaxID=36190 RepID=A0ACB9XDC2_CHAAC|nr:hypothetical protein KUCAC02_020690 [Chaenocephalus aceratus]